MKVCATLLAERPVAAIRNPSAKGDSHMRRNWMPAAAAAALLLIVSPAAWAQQKSERAAGFSGSSTAPASQAATPPANVQQAALGQPGGWRQLTGAEIQALILGHKIGAMNRYDEPALAFYTVDYRVVAQAHPAPTGTGAPRQSPDTFVSDEGTWRIVGNQLCTTMRHWMDAIEQCGGWQTDGKKYLRVGEDRFRKPEIYLDSVPWVDRQWTWKEARN